ncbi:hypothetical protein DICVIV_09980 [Dictyocaulus viviparus]|uniref:Uncharacterized protein n=1 Tax=Dictyocaulus viviparus TaxID=29172 RepID=A0A0D8XJT2_DICVI|nr:hypothetical protein DICVIV_09980 [Dictyocaulus viviparus]
MEDIKGDELIIWNGYLIKLLRMYRSARATYNSVLLSKLLAVLSHLPILTYETTTIESLMDHLKGYLQRISIPHAVLSSGKAFEEIPLPSLENRERHHENGECAPSVASSDSNSLSNNTNKARSDAEVRTSNISIALDLDGLFDFFDSDDFTDVTDIEEVHSKMFKNSFECNLVEDLIHGLMLLTRFAANKNSPNEVEFICGLLKKFVEEFNFSVIGNQCSLVTQWINWQTILAQSSKCISYLLGSMNRAKDEAINIDFHQIIYSSHDFFLQIIEKTAEYMLNKKQIQAILSFEFQMGQKAAETTRNMKAVFCSRLHKNTVQ